MTANAQQWKENAITFGTKHAEALKEVHADPDGSVGNLYYDGLNVFYDLFDLTGNPKWKEDAKRAFDIYVTRYILVNNGAPSYWTFPHGILRHYEENKKFDNEDARNAYRALELLPDTSYQYWGTPASSTWGADMRTIAYAMNVHACWYKASDKRIRPSYGEGGDLQEKRTLKYHLLTEHAYSVTVSYIWYKSMRVFQPFMAGLLARALIDRYDLLALPYSGEPQDPRILITLKTLANHCWKTCWYPEEKAFAYCQENYTYANGETCHRNPSPDLNLLIAPMYGWLHKYSKLKDSIWKQRGDEIFNGGVEGGYLWAPKQFNQNYYWSKKYLEWTNQLP
jgi:hypothetical protein